MKNSEFIEIIKGTYDYDEGDSNDIIVYGSHVELDIESLPPEITFKNRGEVHLPNLEVIDGTVYFENGGDVVLSSLKSIKGHISFSNGNRSELGGVYLDSLEFLPERFYFGNGGHIYLPSLKSLPPGVRFFDNFGYYPGAKQDIDFDSLEFIPENRVFGNSGYLNLPSIKVEGLSKGVKFMNKGDLKIGKGKNSLAIEGIDFKRCVNSMIEGLNG